MNLKKFYLPIKEELREIELILRDSFNNSRNEHILRIGDYLLEPPGKRIRPAILLLSAKATSAPLTRKDSLRINVRLIKIAAGIELIHIASLVHDDVIDKAELRHKKPTLNACWGEPVSIALGDYIYSLAFEIISQIADRNTLECISSATRLMCEGEFLQVYQRTNMDLSYRDYIIIIKKKTASLFSVCCQVGAMNSTKNKYLQIALKGYGLNFGIAFQIVDDFLDIISLKKTLGKDVGQDIKMGEITLPILILYRLLPFQRKKELKTLLSSKDKKCLNKIKEMIFKYGVDQRIRRSVISFINSAKQNIEIIPDSCYKDSLMGLADLLLKRGFDDKG